MAAWSFSRLKSFETCPKQFYHMSVLKEYPQEETQAMLYGSAMHKAAEDYVKADVPIDARFKYIQPALDELKDIRGIKLCEKKMGLTKELKPCGFYDKKAWFRGVVDLAIIDILAQRAWIVDYKTGKSTRYADKDQLELMALCIFKEYPDIEYVNAALLFVVAEELIDDAYHIDNSVAMWGKWFKRHERMQQAFDNDVWNPRPSGLCKYHCPVVECAHNGRN